MTNNELSRKALRLLLEKGGSIRFQELTDKLAADARTVFKNLFFLEEKGFVRLGTSYPTAEAVYPQIHLIKMRGAGEELLNDNEKLDAVFPLSDTTSDVKPHIPPELNGSGNITFFAVLESLANRVREALTGEERDSALEKVESLMSLPFINEKVSEKPRKK